jgi:DNA-binding XRE family transcriptional regulator
MPDRRKSSIEWSFEVQRSILSTMAKRTPPTFPAARRQLADLGERLRAARRRRRLTQAVVAARVGVSKQTLAKLEAGNPSTSLATMLRVLQVLGLSRDIDRLAADDELGRRLQDEEQRDPPRGRSAP